MNRIVFVSLITLLFGVLTSCNSKVKETVQDSFMTSSYEHIEYAKGFEIHHNQDNSIVKIIVLDLENEGRVLQTIFLHKNEFEKDSKSKNHFTNPLGNISVASTTHASYLLSLGLEKNIKGIAWASYVQNEKIIAQVESGETIDITGSSEVDLEKLLATNSNAYTNYPFGMDENGKLGTLELPVIMVSEYLEQNPLARAEWIKFFGALYDKSAEANYIFNQIKKEYQRLKTQASLAGDRPSVVIGSEQNGIWHMPGADSFISQMIQDAGGQYLFDDFPGKNNQQVDLEVLLERAENVDFWGKISNQEITYNKLLAESKKLLSIEAIKKGDVFSCNTATTDYFGMAVMEPQIILKDLVKILHPEVLENYEGKYFKLITDF